MFARNLEQSVDSLTRLHDLGLLLRVSGHLGRL